MALLTMWTTERRHASEAIADVELGEGLRQGGWAS
jgi:hypothetical protein